jgi:hypothetical protein
MNWRRQTPESATMISELWGDRQADGSSGSLLRLPLHAHGGDFHGIVFKGAMIPRDLMAKAATLACFLDRTCTRQAAKCISTDASAKNTASFFMFQYARADIIGLRARRSDPRTPCLSRLLRHHRHSWAPYDASDYAAGWRCVVHSRIERQIIMINAPSNLEVCRRCR